MDPYSFKGTIFHVWKANQPCRIYVTGGRVYFIRRPAAAMKPGAAAVLGSQFGLIGGLAVGLARAASARRSDLVQDNDLTPPDELLSKHADNYAISVSDILDSKIDLKGKYMSYGSNSGRWHFTRRGEAKETVVLMESPADARQAAILLGGPPPDASSAAPSNDGSESDLVTDLPLPPEHA